jgi:alkanesulfonate monooxygenase SsuD/methylene tetrahydromethanopterin reductase-like flavin-dependent oxidoreductase (luciferase family)
MRGARVSARSLAPGSPLGVVLGSHMPPERIAPTARRAEKLGLGELWFSEDCFFLGGPTGICAALAATERLPVGLGIASVMTRHPALLAMEAATISRLHPGRFWPGVGLGVPFWLGQMGLMPRSPLTALREGVTGLRRLLAGEEVTSAGEVFSFDAVALTHPPQEQLPIYFGMVGPKGLRLAGELGDGTVLSVLAGVDYVRWAREQIRAGAEAAGRASDPHRVVTYVLYSVDHDSRTAKEAVREATAFYLHAMPDNALSEVYGVQGELQELVARGGPELVARELPDAWLEDLAVAGDPDEVAAKVRALLDAGSDAVALWLFPLDRGDELLELTAREVLPRL